MARDYWLVKQEPEDYAWANLVRDGRTQWTGVRNYQARNHLRAMKVGDLVLYYHSVSEKQIVGIARVVKEAYRDPTAKEGDWSAVDLAPLEPLPSAVTLQTLKDDPRFAKLALLKQSRLSVMRVSPADYKRIVALGKR